MPESTLPLVAPGTMLALLGPRGAGLTRALSDLADRAGGRAALLGDDPEAQTSGLTTVVDDEVQLPARLHGQAPARARAQADAVLARLHIEHLRRRRIDALSGGERQLVALAAVLSLGAQLLLLDQPSLSLDPAARRRLAQALRLHCAHGGSVVVGAHQHDEITAAAHAVRFLDRDGLSAPCSPEILDDQTLAARGVWNTLHISSQQDHAPRVDGAWRGRGGQGECQLQAERLCVTRSGAPVLGPVDLAVHAGETLTVLGPNGSGKSTLLRALAGLTGPTGRDRRLRVNGSITARGLVAWVGQHPSVQLSASTVRREIELVRVSSPQAAHGHRSARRMFGPPSPQTIDTVLEVTGLQAVAHRHPYDLDATERSDVTIASALAMRPSVLLLDEPTIGRDARGMQRLQRVIDHVTASGGAVITATHDMHWAQQQGPRTLRLSSADAPG